MQFPNRTPLTSFEKIGQIVGPILFGVLFMVKDLHLALVCFGIGYLALTLVFFLTARKDPSPDRP